MRAERFGLKIPLLGKPGLNPDKLWIALILLIRFRQVGNKQYRRSENPQNLVVPDQLSRLSPHRPTSPFPNHAAPQHAQNHFRSTR